MQGRTPPEEGEQILEVPGDEGFKPLVSRGSSDHALRLEEGQIGVSYPLSKAALTEHFRKYVQPKLLRILQNEAYTPALQERFNAFVTQYYKRIDPRFAVVCDTRLVHGVLYVQPHDFSRPSEEA